MSLHESDGDLDEFKKIADNNYKILQNKITKINYSDGVSDGYRKTFQAGFDEGYKDGFMKGFEVENLNSFSTTQNAMPQK